MLLTGMFRYKAAKAFVLISPTLTALGQDGVCGDKRPKVSIVGDKDRLVPYESLKQKVGSLGTPAGVQMVAGADHSWRGHEREAAEAILRGCPPRIGANG